MLFACSGPFAAETIARSELIGTLMLAGGLVACLAVIALARGRGRFASVLMVMLHPGWWLSARSGDCGYLLRYVAPAATVFCVAAAAWVIRRSRVKLQPL